MKEENREKEKGFKERREPKRKKGFKEKRWRRKRKKTGG